MEVTVNKRVLGFAKFLVAKKLKIFCIVGSVNTVYCKSWINLHLLRLFWDSMHFLLLSAQVSSAEVGPAPNFVSYDFSLSCFLEVRILSFVVCFAVLLFHIWRERKNNWVHKKCKRWSTKKKINSGNSNFVFFLLILYKKSTYSWSSIFPR